KVKTTRASGLVQRLTN
ncbi:exodeoxyribonuclease V, alpha subunit, partial [Vibrio parahaemolyticus EKP-026]